MASVAPPADRILCLCFSICVFSFSISWFLLDLESSFVISVLWLFRLIWYCVDLVLVFSISFLIETDSFVAGMIDLISLQGWRCLLSTILMVDLSFNSTFAHKALCFLDSPCLQKLQICCRNYLWIRKQKLRRSLSQTRRWVSDFIFGFCCSQLLSFQFLIRGVLLLFFLCRLPSTSMEAWMFMVKFLLMIDLWHQCSPVMPQTLLFAFFLLPTVPIITMVASSSNHPQSRNIISQDCHQCLLTSFSFYNSQDMGVVKSGVTTQLTQILRVLTWIL